MISRAKFGKLFFLVKSQTENILGFVGQEENWGDHVCTYIRRKEQISTVF